MNVFTKYSNLKKFFFFFGGGGGGGAGVGEGAGVRGVREFFFY